MKELFGIQLSAISGQLIAFCFLYSAYCLLLSHLIHRLPIPRHPVPLTGNFLDRLLIAIEGLEIRLEAFCFFIGGPDFFDHDLTLMFKPNTGNNSAIIEENIGNEEGSDDDEQGAAPRLEDLFRDTLEPAGLLNSSEEIAVHYFEGTSNLAVLQTGSRFEPV